MLLVAAVVLSPHPTQGRHAGSVAFGDAKINENISKTQTCVLPGQCPQKLKRAPQIIKLVQAFLPVCPVPTNSRQGPLWLFPETAASNVISSQSFEVNEKRKRQRCQPTSRALSESAKSLGPLGPQHTWPQCHSSLSCRWLV